MSAVARLWLALSLFTCGQSVMALHENSKAAKCIRTVTQGAPDPVSLYKKIVQLANLRPKIEGRLLAQFWVEYELSKKPHHSTFPLKKTHRYLHVELNRVFRSRVSRMSQIQFLSYLRKHDFELYEYAVHRIEEIQTEGEARAEAFEPSEVVDEWVECKVAQDLAEALFPDCDCERDLHLVLRQVSRGEMGREKTLKFLWLLYDRDSELYETFARVVLESLKPGDPNEPNYERWAKEWNELYQQRERGSFLPSLEEHPQLLKSLQFYLNECDEATQRRFFASLKRRNAVLFAYALGLDEFVRAPLRTPQLPDPPLSVRNSVREWDLFFRSKISTRSLLPQVTTHPRLYEALKRLLSGVTLPIHFRGFLQVLGEHNQVLYWYLRFEKKRTEQMQALGYGLAELHAERWAFEWIDYVRTRDPDEPLYPVRSRNRSLHIALSRFRIETATEGERLVFLSALKDHDPELWEYAISHLNAHVPLDPYGRTSASNYEHWASEWIAYRKTKLREEPLFPSKKDHSKLYQGLRRYRTGEIRLQEWTAFMQYLADHDRVLRKYAEEHFEEPEGQ